jgi:N-carbamoyl-L-amino-acid hydrolase
MNRVEVNGKRLLHELAIVGQIGADPAGGVTRLAFTPPDLTARSWLIGQAEKVGLTVSIDAVGNVLALEEDAGNALPVLSGSHLDTVPNGGRFDGMLGVIAALESIRAIREQIGTANRRPLGVLILAAEESSRFGSGCLGSRMIIQDLQPQDLRTLTDAEGITLFQAMKKVGLQPDRLLEAGRTPGWFHEFVEIHIDQGDDLFKKSTPVGIVTAIAAPTRLWVTFDGQQAHSGATLMNRRQDALTGAAELALVVEAAASARMDQEIVGTVGILNIKPGSMNVIPGRAELGIDIRGIDAGTVAAVVQQVTENARQIAEKRRLQVNVSTLSHTLPMPIAAERISALETACKTEGSAYIQLVSRSAHDALYLGRHGPASMLFVRNPAGISHNPAEAAWDQDIITGTTVLATYLAWSVTQ